MPNQTDLSKYDNSWYKPGRNFIWRFMWYIFNAFVMNSYFPFSSYRIFVLKVFGAQIGHGVVIKPKVNIKYPWRLKVGNHVWIGENVWIDNLDDVIIGNNVCISQGALLLSGNHNYTKPGFDLIIGKITLGDGAWIGAKAVVCPDTEIGSHAVVIAGSVASGKLEAYGIYRGNKAMKIKDRNIQP
jgi:putative colanic acid biosynthesis acetyltransferase WcaF